MESEIKISEKSLVIAVLTIIVTEIFMARILGYMALADIPKVGLIRLVQLIELICIVYIFNKDASVIGISKTTILNGLKKGLIWSAAFGGLAGTAFVTLFLSGVNPFDLFNQELPTNIRGLVIFYLVGGLIGPVAEEVFFRGYIYGFFRKWGVAFGIIASSTIFAVLHMKGGGIPYIQIAGGLVFAISYEIEKSLFVPIVIHVTGNIALFTISLV